MVKNNRVESLEEAYARVVKENAHLELAKQEALADYLDVLKKYGKKYAALRAAVRELIEDDSWLYQIDDTDDHEKCLACVQKLSRLLEDE